MVRKQDCKCPDEIKKYCKHSKVTKTTECKDVNEIIKALKVEDELRESRKRPSAPPKEPRFKTKPFRPPPSPSDAKLRLGPPMHDRVRFATHCPQEPAKAERIKPLKFVPDLQTLKERHASKSGKAVTYDSGTVGFPEPFTLVKHTESDASILNVPSPKLSGEVIPAQRAAVRPALPPKTGMELYKPRSGVVINAEKGHVPDPGYHLLPPAGMINVCEEPEPLGYHKEGVCNRKTCNKKRCRKFAAMKKQKEAKKKLRRLGKRKSRGNEPCSVHGGKKKKGEQKPYEDDCLPEDIPKQEHAYIPANLKRGTLETHSLTVLPCNKEKKSEPVYFGILTGSYNMYDSKFGGRSRGRQALTMSVMAYCLAFHYHPKQWTMKLIDNLVDAGDTWYIQCLDKVHDHSAVQGMCEVLPFGKKQTLSLNGKKMQVLLGDPDIVGYTMSKDPMVYNLCRGLKAFFKDNRAGVLLSRVLKVVIWKDRICYYIFDPAGRDSRAYSNFTAGRAALINVATLEHVADVLLARTVLEDQKFVLAYVKVLKMADEAADEDFESDQELTQAEKAMMGFRILDENCAIVNANMHLGDRCFEDARFRQAVPVAVVAMTYAKISPPNTWFTKTLDKILRLGNKLYLDCLQPKVMIDMTIDNIPNEITIGPYVCEIIIYRERVKGQLFTTKECLFNIKSGLEDFFKHEHNSGILEFNNYTLAVWRQKDMYYMFDPYPRANDGQRGFKKGRACCWMLLNPATMASVFIKNWDYMPATSQFYIHAFKVLKLKKNQPKTALVCTLSDENIPTRKRSRKVLPAQGKGDGKETFHDVMPNESVRSIKDKKKPPDTAEMKIDEEQMGDIISLVDSIQDDFIPAIPLKYKNMPPEPPIEKVVSLDSPTVSVTQVVPPWPKPRDKTNELPEPDPDPEPTPPPTPPPPPIPEGGEEEQEEAAEEEEDEETIAAKKEEAARLKAEEEEARRKAEELPPPFPPPPPSPQGEPEELSPLELADLDTEREVETVQPPVNVERKILLTEDAKTRFKLRQIRKKATPPLDEQDLPLTPSQELAKPSNFITLPDGTGIIRGKAAIVDLPKMADSSADILPFAAIMAIVTSYKYCVNTWTSGLVDFVVSTASKLYMNKKERFQVSPVHIIPKIGIGHQTFSAHIDVATEGPTWQMEEILRKRFLDYIDRGMLTTPSYSCAFFRKNNIYYLFDGSPCNPMGLSNKAYEEDHAGKDKKERRSSTSTVGGGKACLMRFQNLHDMVARIMYNKDGISDDQQFIVSKVLVRRLLVDPRMKLPEDYDYDKGMPKSKKSKTTFADSKHEKKYLKDDQEEALQQPPDPVRNGYQLSDGVFRIEGTTALKDTKAVPLIKACHFVSLIAMLMATMHPLRTWNHQMVDTCIEKGLEIYEKAVNRFSCEKRVIRNIMIGGKFININIKKIMVVNENVKKTLEQYIRAVMKRLRYVIVRYPEGSMVIVQSDNQFHLFDPYPAPAEEMIDKDKKKDKKGSNKGCPNASWTLYKTQEDLIRRIRKMIPGGSADNPEFYTFELTSVKQAPRHSAINYRLSPMFKPDENPNAPYLHPRKVRPLVNEKMYWLDIDSLPWSRMNGTNDLGFDRKTPRTLWNEWDIEFPGDLYSLFGNIHPKDKRFDESTRGQQYLATSVVGIVMTKIINLKAWTSGLLDGIVEKGNAYHKESIQKIGSNKNHEMTVEDLAGSFDMYPYTFTVKFSNVIFGFVYNIFPDRFNLSKALDYFFEKYTTGLLTSAVKNLAFGKIGYSYFMFDCQTYGSPTFCFGKGAAYIFKCESLNRLVYCMTMAINAKKHGLQFNLYNVDVKVGESSKKPIVAEK